MQALFKILLIIIAHSIFSTPAFALFKQLAPVFRYVDLGNGQVQMETGTIYTDGRFVSNIEPVISTDTSIFGEGVLSAISGKIITEQAVYTGFKPIIDKKFRRSKQTYSVTNGEWVVITVAGAKPILTIAAFDSVAAESHSEEAQFDNGGVLILLNQARSTSTVVKFTLSGTAENGKDFVSIPAKLKIPTGKTSGLINIIPLDDSLTESTETVTLTLSPRTGFKLGTNKKATVQILDDD